MIGTSANKIYISKFDGDVLTSFTSIILYGLFRINEIGIFPTPLATLLIDHKLKVVAKNGMITAMLNTNKRKALK